jgi:hypothetical protein
MKNRPMTAGKAILTTACLAFGLALGNLPSPVTAAGGSGGGGGGGGGTGAIPQVAGIWSGQIFFPAPPQLLPFVMTLAEDSSGNITGTGSSGPQYATVAIVGTARSDGTIQLRVEGAVLNGGMTPSTCPNGTPGSTMSGSVQERGAAGSFSFSNCQ